MKSNVKKSVLWVYFFIFFQFFNLYSSQIVVGVTKIVIWNYWEVKNNSTENKYLLFNPLDENISLSIRVVNIMDHGIVVTTQKDTNFSVLGPIEIISKNYVIIDNVFLFNNKVKNKLLQFIINDSLAIGFQEPIIARPSDFFVKESYITTKNSVSGSEFPHLFWSQENIVFEENSDYTIDLNVFEEGKYGISRERQITTLVTPKDSINDYGEQLSTINSVTSGTLKKVPFEHKRMKKAYKFDLPQSGKNRLHTISFQFTTPPVNKTISRRLNVWDGYAGKKGRSNISLPIIIVPKE